MSADGLVFVEFIGSNATCPKCEHNFHTLIFNWPNLGWRTASPPELGMEHAQIRDWIIRSSEGKLQQAAMDQ